MLPTQDTNHVAEGLALRTGKYLNKANIAAALKAFLNGVQDAENVLWDVINAQLLSRTFPAGTGPGELDGPPDQALLQDADLVGVPVGTWTTRQLVFLVGIWILARKSEGLAPDIVGILAAAFPEGATYEELSPASFEVWAITVPDLSLIDALGQAITIARTPGVYAVLAYTADVPANLITFGDPYADPPVAGSGFMDPYAVPPANVVGWIMAEVT